MATFKCKMCGGSLEVTEDMIVCECEFCGHKQNISKSYRIPLSIDNDDEYDDDYYEEDENDEEDEDNEKEIARKLKRGYTCLKIEDWIKARDYFRDVLRYNDDECAEAYLGIFLADYELKIVNELENTDFDDLLKEDNYKEAYLFGNKALKKKLKYYAEINADSAKEKDKIDEYNWAVRQMTEEPSHYSDFARKHPRSAEEIEEVRKNNYIRAKEIFQSHQYTDSAEKIKECDELIAEWDRKVKVYESIESIWKQGSYRNLKKAYNKFKSIDNYLPAKEYIYTYEEMKHNIKRKIKSVVIFTIIFLILYFLNFMIFHERNENVWNIMLVTVSIIAAWSFIRFIICGFNSYHYDNFISGVITPWSCFKTIPKQEFKQKIIYLISAISSAGVLVLSNYLFIIFLSGK